MPPTFPYPVSNGIADNIVYHLITQYYNGWILPEFGEVVQKGSFECSDDKLSRIVNPAGIIPELVRLQITWGAQHKIRFTRLSIIIVTGPDVPRDTTAPITNARKIAFQIKNALKDQKEFDKFQLCFRAEKNKDVVTNFTGF